MEGLTSRYMHPIQRQRLIHRPQLDLDVSSVLRIEDLARLDAHQQRCGGDQHYVRFGCRAWMIVNATRYVRAAIAKSVT